MTNLVEYQYRILNIKAVIEITALSRSTIYEMINPKSNYYDANFSQTNSFNPESDWLGIAGNL